MSSDTLKRNTKQKKAILDCMRGFGSEHFTADELLAALKADGTAVGRATVYRALAKFEVEGAVKRYCLHDDACTCYQFIGADSECLEHYHMRCDRCGCLLHFDSEALDALLAAIAVEHRFAIDGRRTVFYGVCTECDARTKGIISGEGGQP